MKKLLPAFIFSLLTPACRRQVSLFILFLLFFSPVTAQWVTIPDPNFAAWLTANYPTCMKNGNEMDTTCSGILNTTILVFGSRQYFYGLDGIQYFDSLKTLEVTYQFALKSLPALPPSLKYLRWRYNTQSFSSTPALPILPTLPTTLVYLV